MMPAPSRQFSASHFRSTSSIPLIVTSSSVLCHNSTPCLLFVNVAVRKFRESRSFENYRYTFCSSSLLSLPLPHPTNSTIAFSSGMCNAGFVAADNAGEFERITGVGVTGELYYGIPSARASERNFAALCTITMIHRSKKSCQV